MNFIKDIRIKMQRSIIAHVTRLIVFRLGVCLHKIIVTAEDATGFSLLALYHPCA